VNRIAPKLPAEPTVRTAIGWQPNANQLPAERQSAGSRIEICWQQN